MITNHAFSDMDEVLTNPWANTHLEDFLYFCCPECNIKDQSKESFLKHALDKHPRAKMHILPDFEIKKELFEDDNYNGSGIKFERNGKVKHELGTNKNEFIENVVVKCEVQPDIYYEDNDFIDNTGSSITTWAFVQSTVTCRGSSCKYNHRCEHPTF